MHKWLFSGELYDPFEEFFVSADSSLGHLPYVHPSSLPGAISTAPNDGGFGGGFNDNDDFFALRINGQKLWEAKYRFRKEMLPTFVGEPFGKKVWIQLQMVLFPYFLYRYFPREKASTLFVIIVSIVIGFLLGKK